MGDDTALQAAVLASRDDSVICITADITVSQTLVLDDTSVTFEGSGSVSLSGAGARRIIDADFTTGGGEDDTLTIRDLTLTQGRVTDGSDGGAVRVVGGDRGDALVLSGATVSESYTTADGGGVSATNLASVAITQMFFSDDSIGTAGGATGGALEIRQTSTTTITDSIFSDNYSVNWGGAVFLNDSGVTRITGSTFQRNSSGTQAGGAIEVDIDDSTLPGALYIEDTIFQQNSSASGNGGAVRITDADDTVSLTSVGFYSNSADTGHGGALNISSQTGAVTLTDVTAWDNYAQNEGGFVKLWDSTAPFTVTGLDSRRNESIGSGGSMNLTGAYQYVSGSTFYDDSTSTNGGGIRSQSALNLQITGSTFNGNYARLDGGAVMTTDDSEVAFTNTHFTSNRADDDGGAVEINDARNVYVNGGYFRSNDAGGGDGGGILMNGVDDTVAFANITFDSNSTAVDGGGVKTLNHQGVFIADSLAFTGNTSGVDGGGMYAAPDEALLRNSTFIGNSAVGAASDGGALYLRNALAHDFSNLTFSGNFSGRSGGSVFITSNDGVTDTTTLSNLVFTDDSAGEDGGSVYARVEGLLNMTSVTATGTTSGDDGGFAYLRSDDTSVALADFTLSDVHVTSASTTGGGADGGGFSVGYANGLYLRDVTVTDSNAADDGGGMLVRRVAAVYIYESSFQGNAAGDVSGGVDLTNVYSQLLVRDSTISGNSAVDYTGGLYTRFAADTQATILNSTITGNTVPSTGSLGGGGMYLFGAPGTSPVIDLSFVTITGNAAKVGGGIQLGGTSQVNAENSIIAGNTASSGGADVYLTGSASLDDSFSLFTSASAVSGVVVSGPGTLFGAPKLNGLADNGGPTKTMLPQWDSPAVKTGNPNWTAPPANDQRGSGFPRDAGGRVNMGAIQGASAQPPAPTYPPSAPREVTAVAGDQQAVLSWQAPASTGSFPITDYQIDDSTGTVSTLIKVSPGQPLVATIEELVNGTEYSFRVRALNGAGWGPWSDYSNPVIPTREAAILITGSRDGRFVKVDGTSTGIAGQSLIPRVRFPGPKGYKDGTSRPTVDAEGDFTWQRKTGKKTYVYFLTENDELRSNRVVIQSKK